jgi:MscS family membrane protein
MNFFDRIFLDNTIRNYCLVAGIIILMFILKKYLSRYIAALLYRIVNKIWKTVQKASFVDLVVEPLEWFLVLLIAIFAIDKLNFPTQFIQTLYGHPVEEIVNRFGIGIIIASFTWLLLRMIDFIAIVLEEKASLTKDKSDDQLIVFFRDFLKIFIGIGGLLLIIKACFNQPIGQLLIGLSFIGAAFAFAAKESLENLIASFIIFFDKPFVTGDFLKINQVSGRVEKIGLRSTRIRTDDKTLVTVPNKQMVDSVVDNWSMRTQRRGLIALNLDTTTTAQNARLFVEEAKKIMDTKNDLVISYTVLITELSNNGIKVIVEYFTNKILAREFNGLKQELNLEMKALLENKQIDLLKLGAFQ